MPPARWHSRTLALFEHRLAAEEQPILLDTLTWESLPKGPRPVRTSAAGGQSSGEGSRGDTNE